MPGLQPLRRDLLRSALRFYEDFVKERGDDPTLKAGLAAAQLRLAKIQHELGAEPQAQDTLRQAMELYETASRNRPDDRGLRDGLAQCCVRLGIAQMPSDQALARFERAITLWQALRQAEPANTLYQRELANTYNLIAVLHDQRDRLAESLRAHEQAFALRRALVAAHPDDPSFQNALAATLNNLGVLLDKTSPEDQEKLAMFRRSVEHSRIACAAAPEVVQYGRFLVAELRNVGAPSTRWAIPTGRCRLSASRSRSRGGWCARTRRSCPCGASCSRITSSVGDLHREQGREAEAVQSHRQAIELLDALPRETGAGLFQHRLLPRPVRPAGQRPWLGAQRRGAGRVPAQRRCGDGGAAAGDRGGLQKRRFLQAARRAECTAGPRRLQGHRGRARIGRPGSGSGTIGGRAPRIFPGSSRGIRGPEDRGSRPWTAPGRGHRASRPARDRGRRGRAGPVRGSQDHPRPGPGRAPGPGPGDPGNARYRADVASTRVALGRLAWKAGRLAEAVGTWQEVRHLLEAAIEENPNEPVFAQQLAQAEVVIGQSYAEKALWDEAAEAMALAVRHGLTDRTAAVIRMSLLAVTRDRDALLKLGPELLDATARQATRSSPAAWPGGVHWCPASYPTPAGSYPSPSRPLSLGIRGLSDPSISAWPSTEPGAFEDAIRHARESLASDPGGETGPLGAINGALLAMAHHRLGQRDEARRWLDKINHLDWRSVERWPSPESWWQRSDFLVLKREAVELITGKPAPDDPWLREERGHAYAQLGESAKAEAELQAAHAARSDSSGPPKVGPSQ